MNILYSIRERCDVDSVRSIMPGWLSSYCSLHVDTIPKAVNHVLAAMGLCNTFLLLTSFSASALPNMGFNIFLVALISCAQNALIFMALNNQRLSSRFDFLTNTYFAVGIMVGVSMMMSFITLMVSIYFGQMSKCQPLEVSVDQYVCERKGAMWSVWFWGGLLFWLNGILSVLMVVGKDDLTLEQNRYEDIGVVMDHYETPPEGRIGIAGGGGGDRVSMTPSSFEGDFPASHQTSGPMR